VPYALKAEDAQTLGGLPASAFVQASPAAKAGVSGGPVLIMADVGGIASGSDGSACQAALFYIVMDKQVVSQHEVLLPNVGVLAVGNVTMVSLQTPTAGTHTFQIQETDDASSCGSGDYSPTIVSFLWGAPWGAATRTLIVREL
jgi:hypothetical protein